MDDFSILVAMRERRADQATLEKSRAEDVCNAARKKVADVHAEVGAFAEATRNLEFELLTDLVDKPITVEHVQEIEQRLADAQAEADALVAALNAAKAELSIAEIAIETKRQAKRESHGKLNRISELNSILLAEAREMAQAKEDAEIDAFVETMPLSGQGSDQ